jgi:hypothetical protein
MLLLAILTGYPSQATEILRALLEEEHHETWREFVATYKASILAWVESAAPENTAEAPAPQGQGRGRTAVLRQRREATPPAELEQALDLVARLERLEGHFADRRCTDFQPWAARVARFSFQSGRVLLGQRSCPAPVGGWRLPAIQASRSSSR